MKIKIKTGRSIVKMNETIRTILNRRSYRAYKPEQITKEELSAILDCGLSAPSAMNSQNWYFTVIQNKDLIDWMNEQVKPELPQASRERMIARNGGNEGYSVFYNAPTVIWVSGSKDDKYSAMNCSFAAQNMCIAAESLNIGTCIIGMATLMFDTPKGGDYMKELGISDGYKPMYAICFGYKGMDAVRPETIQNKVSYIE